MAKLKPNKTNLPEGRTEDIDHEVVTLPAPKSEIITVDQKISQEVARFDIGDAVIAKMKEDYSGLTISGIDDVEGYKVVKSAWQETRNLRIKIEKKRQEIKGDHLTIGRAIDKKAADYTWELEPLEDDLRAKWAEIDQAKEEERTKAEREKEQKAQARISELIDNGIRFNGSFYAIGETISIDVLTLKNMADEDFPKLLDRVKTENKKILDAKAEADRKVKEEREAFERHQKEQKEERERMELAMKKFEEEKRQMKLERTKIRIDILKNAGFELVADSMLQIKNERTALKVYIKEFEDLDGNEWDKKYYDLRQFSIEIKREQQVIEDAREAQRLEEERKKKDAEQLRQRSEGRTREIYGLFPGLQMDLSKTLFYREFDTEVSPETFVIGLSVIENQSNSQWNEYLENRKADFADLSQREDENKRWQIKQTEIARQAKLSDVEKVKEWITEFNENMSIAPKIEDQELKEGFQAFEKSIKSTVSRFTDFIEAVERKESNAITV